jgi:hypothetical protein
MCSVRDGPLGQGFGLTAGYFTTGKEPQLLGNYDSWWFDSVETSKTRWEWESVERT